MSISILSDFPFKKGRGVWGETIFKNRVLKNRSQFSCIVRPYSFGKNISVKFLNYIGYSRARNLVYKFQKLRVLQRCKMALLRTIFLLVF